jgi:hypothetical protein
VVLGNAIHVNQARPINANYILHLPPGLFKVTHGGRQSREGSLELLVGGLTGSGRLDGARWPERCPEVCISDHD